MQYLSLKLHRYSHAFRVIVLLLLLSLWLRYATPIQAVTNITSCEGLQAMQDNLMEDYILGGNIDCTGTSSWNAGAGFLPVGQGEPFQGSLDGNGFTVNGLTINAVGQNNVGLFAQTAGNLVVIKNIKFTNTQIHGANNVAGLVGTSQTLQQGLRIENVDFRGTIQATGNRVAGLVGSGAIVHIRKSVSRGQVTGGNFVGGMVGQIANATGPADVSIDLGYGLQNIFGQNEVGGLVGAIECQTTFEYAEAACRVTRSFGDSELTASAGPVGGLIGFATAPIRIEQAFARESLTVTAENGIGGGLIGKLSGGMVENSYSTTTVALTAANCVGGNLIGVIENNAQVNNSYTAGFVATDTGCQQVGGFVGRQQSGTIQHSISLSTLAFNLENATAGSMGNFAGAAFGNYQDIAAIFWMTQANCIGTPDASCTRIEPMDRLNYFGTHAVAPFNQWDFTTVWEDLPENGPQLRWADNWQALAANGYPEVKVGTPTDPNAPGSNPSTNTNNAGTASNQSNSFCSEPILSAPDLFQVNTTAQTAQVFFTPLATNQYFVSFSTLPSAEEHGAFVTLSPEGVQNLTVFFLHPRTKYYFKVRGQNGCMPGQWSNIMEVTTKSGIFYRYAPATFRSFNLKPTSLSTTTSVTPSVTPRVSPTQITPSIRPAGF